jgi:hypothetical protein
MRVHGRGARCSPPATPNGMLPIGKSLPAGTSAQVEPGMFPGVAACFMPQRWGRRGKQAPWPARSREFESGISVTCAIRGSEEERLQTTGCWPRVCMRYPQLDSARPMITRSKRGHLRLPGENGQVTPWMNGGHKWPACQRTIPAHAEHLRQWGGYSRLPGLYPTQLLP